MNNNKLIDVNNLYNEFERAAWHNNADRDIAEDILLSAPTVVQTAHWINRAYESLQCSNCGRRLKLFDEPENYCPRCGYYMKGE